MRCPNGGMCAKRWKMNFSININQINKIMEKVKESIAPRLKGMQVGDKIAYPMERYATVQNTLVRVRRELSERKYTTSCLSGQVEVTRVQ